MREAPTHIAMEGPASIETYSAVRTRRRIVFVVIGALLAVSLGASLVVNAAAGAAVAAAAAAVFLLPLFWRRPILTVYAIFFGVGAFDAFRLHYPDSLTDRFPLFASFASLGGPSWLAVTPIELLIILGLVMVALKRMAARESPVETGPLFPALLAFSGMVLFGLAYGLVRGGDSNAAIWEVRALLYLLPMYLLALNLIRTKPQMVVAVSLLMVGIALKSLLGVFRYLVTLGGNLSLIDEVSSYNSLLAHEESFFFALFFALVVTLFLFRSNRKQLLFGALFSLPVLFAFLANQRRMGTLVLAFAVIVAVVMALVLVRNRRKMIVGLALLGLVALPPYLAAFGNSTGLIGEPASAILSVTRPDDRDLGSNTYRTLESQNLKYNISIDPVQGQGFGHPMVMFLPIPDLTEIFPFWAYIPHNSILWIWLRLGVLGFAALWFLVGRGMVEAGMVAKATRDPYMQTIAVMCAFTIIGWVALAAVDMGLTDLRVNILVAGLLGIVARISVINRQDSASPEPSGAAMIPNRTQPKSEAQIILPLGR